MTAPTILNYEQRTHFVCGKFVAIYLLALGLVSIGSIIVRAIFFDTLRVDFSFIFLFWAAYGLMRQSRRARVWVIAISGLILVAMLMMVLHAACFGTSRMTVSYGTGQIKNPAMWQVLLSTGLIFALASVPFFVLLSSKARREFQGQATNTTDLENESVHPIWEWIESPHAARHKSDRDSRHD